MVMKTPGKKECIFCIRLLSDYFLKLELHFRVKEIVAGADAFIKNESIVGPLMVFPWLRHLPFIAARFRASKVQGPIKMRQLQVGNIMGYHLFTTLKLVITRVCTICVNYVG